MSDEILRRATEKAGKGETLSREEQRAVARKKRDEREILLRDGLTHLPKKLYAELSGRQHKVLNEQALRYGLPLLGREINLAEVLSRFHDLLAEHREALAGDGGDSPWGEDCRKQRALLLRLEVAERCQQLLRRPLVEEMLASIAALLRGAAEQLQRQGNTEGFQVLEETLQAAQRESDLRMGEVRALIDEMGDLTRPE